MKPPTHEPVVGADELLLARAFAAVPMLGGAARWRVTALTGGLQNRSWLLTAADAKLVLRMPVHDSGVLGVDRAGERAAIEAAAGIGLAPQLIHFDVTTGMMVSEYVEGRIWSRAEAHDASAVSRLAQRLRALHELELPEGVRRLDYAQLIRDYRRSLETRKRWLGERNDTLVAGADQRLAAIAAAPRAHALCHNDLHHRNILDGRELWLIDWEYAAAGDPMFDLASFACYHDLEVHECRHLLEAYARKPAAQLAEFFPHYCWVFDYMHLLWLDLAGSDGALRSRLLERLAPA
jgi:thiamine kinase